MPDHWNYVMAAYGIAAAALLGYWRYLARRSRAVHRGKRGRSA